MKKLFAFLSVSCLVLLSSSYLMAGVVDNRSNLSGEYVRSLNRNAATDSLDAIVYNPAGVMTMEDGTQANLSVHYVMKDYTNIVDGVALGQDEPSLVPAFFALYKKDKWAGFFSFTIPCGGGKVDYTNGSATTRIGEAILVNMLSLNPAVYNLDADERVTGESVYHGYTIGAAYKLNDIVSFSLAGRYINAEKEARAELRFDPTPTGAAPPYNLSPIPALLDYKAEDTGFGFILGMHLDFEDFNFGMRYETKTELDLSYDVVDTVAGVSPGLGDGLGITAGDHARDLPAVLALGAGYKFTPELRVDVNLTYYFQEDADWEGLENVVDNGWEAGAAVEYKFNEKMKLSAGYLHTDTGMPAAYALMENPELDADSFAAGMTYQVNDKWKIDCGIGFIDYKSDSYTFSHPLLATPILIGYEKDVVMISVGGQYHF